LQPQTLAIPEFEPRYFCAFRLDRPSNGRGGPRPRALSCAVFTATHAVAFLIIFPFARSAISIYGSGRTLGVDVAAMTPRPGNTVSSRANFLRQCETLS
jgi:hypothetical protein